MTEQAATPATEEYLAVIYRLSRQAEPVPLALLAEQLGISPISANEMVRKLARAEMVTYRPYEGVTLTEAGRQRAEVMVRRHRLWERLLTDVLGLPWDAVHAEAGRLEHATSDLLERHLAQYLEQPSTCPHGNPIPGQPQRLEGARALSSLATGERGRVLAVVNEDAALLRALGQAGLVPGAELEVVAAEPALGSLAVRVGDRHVALALAAAAQIMVGAPEGQGS
ncbi:MAG: metal-dependent transcriptional regulator [Chloroflexi bacterium]|nr:metal-dependent transcriptional regulator [Chloroflexota bacterium]